MELGLCAWMAPRAGFDSHFSSLGKTYQYRVCTLPHPLQASEPARTAAAPSPKDTPTSLSPHPLRRACVPVNGHPRAPTGTLAWAPWHLGMGTLAPWLTLTLTLTLT